MNDFKSQKPQIHSHSDFHRYRLFFICVDLCSSVAQFLKRDNIACLQSPVILKRNRCEVVAFTERCRIELVNMVNTISDRALFISNPVHPV
jgi:hypothetical protein